MKIYLFSYSMLGYISPITSLSHIYRRNSCPTHIFKRTHQTGLSAHPTREYFRQMTNLPLLGTFVDPTTTLITSTIFCKKLDFPTANHNRYIKLHWAQFPMIGNTYSELRNFSKILNKNFLIQQ